MTYQPSKEFLFTRILWTGFFPAVQAVNVYNFWDQAGLSQNFFLICSSLLLLFLFAYVISTLARIYRFKLCLGEEAVGIADGIDGVEIKWDEIAEIGVWQESWLFFFFTTLVVKSKTRKFTYCLSLLSESDRQEVKKTIISRVGLERIRPAFN